MIHSGSTGAPHLGWVAVTALLVVPMLSGCGSDGETTPDAGAGGGGGSGPLDCTFGDAFELSRCPASYPEWQCEVYVDGDAASSGDGWSWQGAVRSVQEGIDLAYCGVAQAGVCDEWQVWVKQGTYYVNQGCREHAVWLRPGVVVYGGFVGTETELGGRDPSANETILDGRDGPGETSRVYHVVIGADNATLDGFTVTAGLADHPDDDMLRHGAGLANLDASPTVRGCTFRDNHAAASGGAMINYQDSAPDVSDCRFVDNSAGDNGGAMFNHDGGEPTLVACAFEGNVAERDGGAISIAGDSGATLSNCSFDANRADQSGGAIRAGGLGSVTVEASTFTNNTAGHTGGALAAYQASAALSDCTFASNVAYSAGAVGVTQGRATVTDCTFDSNRTVASDVGEWPSGGALVLGGSTEGTVDRCGFFANESARGAGAVLVGEDALITFADCTFSGNVSHDLGGGMAVSGGEATVTRSAFIDNQAPRGGAIGAWQAVLSLDSVEVTGNAADGTDDGDGYGGALALWGYSASLTDCVISNNDAADFGGGLAVYEASATLSGCVVQGNVAPAGGGLSMGVGASVELASCVFFGNEATGNGGALEAKSAGALSLLNCTIAGNVAGGNGGAIYEAAELTVTNSILWGNDPDELAESGTTSLSIDHSDVEGTGGAGGMGTIDEEPRFVDLDGGDLRLDNGSPCIDRADRGAAPDTDIDGNPRVTGAGGGGSGACAAGGSGGDGPCPDMGAYEYQPPG